MQALNDVTIFLGIPVYGFKSEMTKKLMAKGYTPLQGRMLLKVAELKINLQMQPMPARTNDNQTT